MCAYVCCFIYNYIYAVPLCKPVSRYKFNPKHLRTNYCARTQYRRPQYASYDIDTATITVRQYTYTYEHIRYKNLPCAHHETQKTTAIQHAIYGSLARPAMYVCVGTIQEPAPRSA